MKNHFLFLVLNITIAFGQVYEAKLFEHQGDTLPYRILLPKDYNPQKTYPLLVVLHGAGERGNDNEAQLVHGSYLFQTEQFRAKYPTIVVFPQCPKDSYWANVIIDYELNLEKKYNYAKSLPINSQLEMVEALMVFLEKNYRIDPTRRYVGGLSMGGMGTFEILYRRPNMFAAAIPICGNGSTKLASLYAKKVSIWVFHGSDDKVVSPKHSLNMVNAIIELGGSPKMTLYENVGHNSWDYAFAEKNYLKWIYSKSKK